MNTAGIGEWTQHYHHHEDYAFVYTANAKSRILIYFGSIVAKLNSIFARHIKTEKAEMALKVGL